VGVAGDLFQGRLVHPPVVCKVTVRPPAVLLGAFPEGHSLWTEELYWYANLCRTNKRDFNGIPIVFTDGANL
jgi:hypothetical protein